MGKSYEGDRPSLPEGRCRAGGEPNIFERPYVGDPVLERPRGRGATPPKPQGVSEEARRIWDITRDICGGGKVGSAPDFQGAANPQPPTSPAVQQAAADALKAARGASAPKCNS